MKDGVDFRTVSFREAGETGAGEDEGRSSDQPSKTGGNLAGGEQQGKARVSSAGDDATFSKKQTLRVTGSHQKLRVFVAKRMSLGYPRACLGRITPKCGGEGSSSP